MSLTIYGLYYFEPKVPSQKAYFYVGQSIDSIRREKQHRYAAKNGHEDKYEFMRQLESRGLQWYKETLREIPEGEYPPDNERWFVIKLTRDGHTLMNMRHGSVAHRKELAEQVISLAIRSVSDVKNDRERRKFAASRNLRRRLLEKALRKEGIPDVRNDGLLPRVLKRRLVARGVRSIERGVTLATIVSLERAAPELDRLERLMR